MKNVKHDVLLLAVVVFFVGVLISSVSISDVFDGGKSEPAATSLQSGVTLR